MSAGVHDLPEYPLRLGDTLASHEWVELRVHRLLGSRWRAVMSATPEAGFFGFLLWVEAMRQDPAGTLPDDDVELAMLAGLGGDLDRWRGLRGAGPGEGALYGWSRCLVADAAGEVVTRLAHKTVTEVVRVAWARQTGRRAASRSGAERVRAGRIRRQMEALGERAALVSSERFVARVQGWLSERGLVISRENVREAVETLKMEVVVQMPEKAD